jgi:RimJ/RimL family protein N-acetyltransferase
MFDRLNPDHQIVTYHRLADGSVCRIRPSGAADRALLQECFEALSPESQRMRFFTNKRSLTAQELDLFSGADGYDHIAIAAVRIDASGRELEPLGFARCLRLAPGGDSAELSITVADRFHGQGIGTTLLRRLMEAAYAQGIRRFRFEVLVENRGMRRLAQQLGGEARWLGDGIVEYDCALPEPAVAEPAADRLGAVAGETDTDLPWYLDPDAWIGPWTHAWQANVDVCLSWVQAANEDLGHWLDGDCPLTKRTWRDAA